MATDKKSLVDDDIINIPDWLLWELLLRLPSKFVVRCKLVSKRWASLISDPLFARSYVSRYSPSKQWTLITYRLTIENNNDVSLVEHELPKEIMCSREHFVSLRLPNNNHRGSEIYYKVFVASNDGLILFGLVQRIDRLSYADFPDCYYNPNIYYLCNPATGELISLPQLQPRTMVYYGHRWGPIGLVTRVENHSVLESFRVVLLQPPYAETDRGYLRFSVYASETLQWDEFILPCEIPPEDITYGIPPATLNNQILHWVTVLGSIIAYDPYASPSHIRIIAPPYPRGDERMGFFDCIICDVSGGKLRYFEKLPYKDDEYAARFRMWVLEDYHGLAKWRLSHDASVRGDEEEESMRVLKELGTMFFDPSDTDIIYLADRRGLVSYNVNTRKVKVVQDYIIGRRFKLAVLVQLSPWPINII